MGLLVACTSGGHAPERLERRAVLPDGSSASEAALSWQPVFEDLPSGLTTVWGTGVDDVWVAGSDAKDGLGPMVLHLEAGAWVRKRAALQGDLWWVHGFEGGPVFFGGSEGTVLRFADGKFQRIGAPRTYGTVYGVWGADSADVWAVGGDTVYGTGAFVWRIAGGRFESVTELPVPAADVSAYFKVWGTSRSDVWIVGTPGILLHFDGATFSRVDPGVPDPLFTVHASPSGSDYAAVGGSDLGVLLERTPAGSWTQAALPDGTRLLTGVCLTDSGGYATGAQGTVLSRRRGAWTAEATGLSTERALHSVWVDPTGGAWVAGGDVLVPPFGNGVLIHRGAAIPGTYTVEEASPAKDSRDGGPDARVTPGRDAMPDAPGPPAPRELPDAAAEATPARGSVRCGTTTCTAPDERCCADATTGVPVGCVASSAPCPSGRAPVSCDEPSDCGPGHSCCLNRYRQAGALQNVQCQTSCVGPSVCQTDSDCGGAACTQFPIMKSYDICPPP